MNPSPDYSAAYLVIRTDEPDPGSGSGQPLAGHSYVFTIGQGNEVQIAAIRALEPFLVGRDVDEILGDLGGLYRMLVSISPLRWLGPECGVVHMAIGAVVNACWDLAARRAGKPLWLLLADLFPGGDRRAGRLPVPHRRPHARRGAAACWNAGKAGRAERAEALRGTATRPTPRHPAGSATPTTARGALRAGGRRRLHPGEAQGGRPARRRQAALRARAGDGGREGRHRHRRQPGLGRADRHFLGTASSLSCTRPGLRSRPARGMSSVPPRSGRACARSGWRPASTPLTGWSSSSCSRPGPSTSCRSTPAGWPV